MKKIILLIGLCWLSMLTVSSQPILRTGGRVMPDEWIDSLTGHHIVKLTRRVGDNVSFYFHNNPFIGDWMVFYGRGDHQQKNLYKVNLKTFEIRQLSFRNQPIKGEILSVARKEVFFQSNDSVFGIHVDTGKERLVFVFPDYFKGEINAVNCTGSLLAGVLVSKAEKELSEQFPQKHDYFNRIFDARLPRTLFTINIDKGLLTPCFTDSAWLNHLQFSPTAANLLMFCHEGPWHKVDRIWTIDIGSNKVSCIHHRKMDMEIAGHEWFSSSGKTIWYDLQLPKGKSFYVGGTSMADSSESKFEILRNEWSVHYTSNSTDALFAGDGGDGGSVAKAKEGKWIYLFRPEGDHFSSEKLVDMQFHRYKLEPNVHFSPDSRWVIFRANFEGNEQVYAVEVGRR